MSENDKNMQHVKKDNLISNVTAQASGIESSGKWYVYTINLSPLVN